MSSFQASAGQQGRHFADQCDLLLDGMGYHDVVCIYDPKQTTRLSSR